MDRRSSKSAPALGVEMRWLEMAATLAKAQHTRYGLQYLYEIRDRDYAIDLRSSFKKPNAMVFGHFERHSIVQSIHVFTLR